jgi:RHS repeat-associated protein
MTDAKNQTTLYSYFIDDNLEQVTYSNAVVTTPSVWFTYDTNYNRIVSMTDGTGITTYSYYAVTNGQLGAGMLAAVTGPLTNSTITYDYDALGRTTNRAINSVAQQLTYDALGRVTIITNVLGSFTNTFLGATALLATNFYPNGQKTVLSYFSITNDERLQQIQNMTPAGQNLSTFGYVYDPVGQITNWTEQADTNAATIQTMQYDTVNELLSDTVYSNTMAGAILKQYAYGYDLAANRTSEQIGTGTNGLVAISQSFYNSVNQLTNRASGSGPVQFAGALDKQGIVTVAGNPATVNHFTTNYFGYGTVMNGTNVVPIVATDYNNNSRTNRYQLVVTNNGISETLTYDLDGNLASVVTATSTNIYQWDAANRLVGITNGANQSQFSYDGLGRRVEDAEVQSGVATDSRFVWCGTELCEQRDSTGTNVTKRFFNGGEQISGTNYYFTRDHLGSVREMMDSAGAIRVRYDYDPYGRQTVVSGSMSADFAYAGMFVHQPSELNLTFHRSYSADLGRWTNRDPLEEEAGLNLYDYVDNNPINVVDTLGLSSADVTKLYNLYAQELQRMTDAGERLDTEGDSTIGWLNNLLSWIDPKKKGCGDQAADIYLVVVRQAYDDTWTFDIPQIFRPLPHQFVTATSSNPNDPKITIDPWTGTFYEENPDGTGTLLTVPIIPKAKHCG